MYNSEINRVSCAYCNNLKTVYTCKKCGRKFCAEHVISTENYVCKKHGVRYTEEQAKSLGGLCKYLNKSRCPVCASPIYMNKIPGGDFYLACTRCAWNSYTKRPLIHDPLSVKVLNDAVNLGLLKKVDLCNSKLKKQKGVYICPECFKDFLKAGHITSFDTIKNMYGLSPDDLNRVVNKLIAENRLYGYMDTKNGVFIYFPENAPDVVADLIKKEGMVQISGIANRFNIPREAAVELIFWVLRKYKIFGTFDRNKMNYYSKNYLENVIIKRLESFGRIKHEEIANEFNVLPELIKTYIMELIKSGKISAYFADRGNEAVTSKKLKEDVLAYAKQNGLFKLRDVASYYKVSEELIRRSLFELVREGKLRGLFTQRREFITEEKLLERIRGIVKVYRKIKLRDLANKLGITELRVEEALANLISRGAINGYIDMNTRIFHAEKEQPVVGATVPYTPPAPAAEGEGEGGVEVLREYDFVGGQLHFKVVIRNNTDMAIHSVKVILDVPSSYEKDVEYLTIDVIDPHNSRGVDFYLTPTECGISTIGGTVIYKDARGRPHTIYIRPKEVQIKCPLVVKTLDTIEDIQLAIQTLPSDARAFMIADIDPQLAFRAAFRAVTNFETRNVTSVEIPEPDNYQAEAWFSSEAKVTGGRIITRIMVQGASKTLEIRVWCNDAGQLTGFLAKIVELLFHEINLLRKVKEEARQKTLDVMSITQNLITASDFCQIQYDAREILLKLEDTYERMKRVLGQNEPLLEKMKFWIDRLSEYGEGEKINEEDAEKLCSDIDYFKNVLARSLMPG